MKPLLRLSAWMLSIVLTLLFLWIGWSKFSGSSAQHWQERFAHWGYPKSSQYLIGAIEMLAGAGLVIPRTRRVAASVIMALMLGAAATHLIHSEFPRLIPPVVIGSASLLLYIGDNKGRDGKPKSSLG